VLFWDALTGWQTFDSLADMGAFLESVAENSAAAPYAIRLSAEVDVADFAVSGQDNLGNLFAAFHGKYVALDLSACTGTAIANNNAVKTNARTDPDKLVGIILPEGLETLGNYLFYDDITAGADSSLVSAILPAGLTRIGPFAFHGAALRTIALPASITNLGLNANSGAVFKNCASLASVKAPDGLPNLVSDGIGKECFMNTALASFPFSAINSTQNTVIIGISVFENTRLTSVTATAPSLHNYAFRSCALLEEVTLDGVTTLPLTAFNDCPELRNISFPASLATASDVLTGSPQVTFTVAPGNLYFETALDGKALLKKSGGETYLASATALTGSQTLSGINYVSQYAFAGNTTLAFAGNAALTGLVFETGLKEAAANAFAGCTALASVDLPATLTTLNANAFGVSGLSSLQSLTIRADTVIGAGINGSYHAGFTVYVPAGLVEDYQAATGWSSRTIAALP
jgi:hypothetical protein